MPLVISESVASLDGNPERSVAHLELELQLITAVDG